MMMLRLMTTVAVMISLVSTQARGEGDGPVLANQRDKINYTLGVNIINTFKQQGADIDLATVIKGMNDAAGGGKLLLTDEELRQTLTSYQGLMMQRKVASSSKQAEANKVEGEAFLLANAKNNGVVTLPSGLQYLIVKPGQGATPREGDVVECQFKGTFVNGNEFDSSYRAGHPAIVKIAEMIPGWRQALTLMPTGSTWKLFIPPSLAYGAPGKVGGIGPHTVLIFDLELVAIK